MNSNSPQHEHCHQQTHTAGVKPTGSYDHVPKDYAGTVYTCPMHPEVRDTRNSGCPLCGMALERAACAVWGQVYEL